MVSNKLNEIKRSIQKSLDCVSTWQARVKTHSRRGVLRFAAHRGAFLNAAGLSGARPKGAGALPWQPGANAAEGQTNRKRTGAGVLRRLMLN